LALQCETNSIISSRVVGTDAMHAGLLHSEHWCYRITISFPVYLNSC